MCSAFCLVSASCLPVCVSACLCVLVCFLPVCVCVLPACVSWYAACLQLLHGVWPDILQEPLQCIVQAARLAASLQPDGTGLPQVRSGFMVKGLGIAS